MGGVNGAVTEKTIQITPIHPARMNMLEGIMDGARFVVIEKMDTPLVYER